MDIERLLREAVEQGLLEWPARALEETLKNNKIVIVVTKGSKVTAKLVKIPQPKPKQFLNSPPQVHKGLVEQKKLLKKNTDAFYAFTLLEQTKACIEKLSITGMTPEAVDLFNKEIQELRISLASTQKMLEQIPAEKGGANG